MSGDDADHAQGQRPAVANTLQGAPGFALQAGSVRGGVTVHLPPAVQAFPPPFLLPEEPSGFVDRAVPLSTMSGVLGAADVGRTRVLLVTGLPGVGKTALVTYFAYSVLDRFPDGVLYVDMQGFAPGAEVSLHDVLDVFLHALSVPPGMIPDSDAARAAVFRSLVATKHILMVLDNARSLTTVRQLLPASPGCLTVITCRSELSGLVTREGATRVALDVLPPEESVRLLAAMLPDGTIGSDDPSARRIAELCGHLPLALRIVGARALRRPRLSLAHLVAELESEERRLHVLASAHDELSDVRAAFSWSYQALGPDLRRAFRMLSLHGGRVVSAGAAAALTATGTTAAADLLWELAEVHLLDESGGEASDEDGRGAAPAPRFRMHDLLRSYAAERCDTEETPQDRALAVRRMLVWYLLTSDQARRASQPHSDDIPLVFAEGVELPAAFADEKAAMAWFRRERPNVVAAIRQAVGLGELELAWKLAVTSCGLFELASYWAEWEDVNRIGLDAARRLGDRFGEAANLLLLADAVWRRRHTDDAVRDEARASYEQAARLGRLLSVPWIEGFALRGIGLLHEDADAFTDALASHHAALAVFRAGGLRRGEGMCLLSLGTCARALGDGERAVELGTAAVAIFEELADTWTIAWGRTALATSLAALDRTPEATAHLRQARQTFEELHDPLTEAQTLTSLGDLSAHTGDTAEARRCWSRAAELYDGVGDEASANSLRERTATS